MTVKNAVFVFPATGLSFLLHQGHVTHGARWGFPLVLHDTAAPVVSQLEIWVRATSTMIIEQTTSKRK